LKRAKNLKSPKTQASTSLDSPVFTICTKQHNKPITPKKSEKSRSKRKLFHTINQSIEPVKKLAETNVAGSSAKYEITRDNENRKEENKEQCFNIGISYIPELQSMSIVNAQFGNAHFMYMPWENEFEEYQPYSDNFLYFEPREVSLDREEDNSLNDYDYPWRSQSLPSIFE